MKCRRISNFLLLLAACIIGTSVYAQVDIEDSSDIVGEWRLEMSAPNKDGSNGNKEEATWDFRSDGTVIIAGYNKFINQDTRFEKNYEVITGDNPVIKIQDNLGTTNYKIVKKEGDEMILEGPYVYHFFKKQ